MGLAWYSALIAASAYAGAVGLASGGIDTGGTINNQLPFHSPALGAVALALIVGIPSKSVAWRALRGDRTVRTAALIAGILLVGWIVVEAAFIRELSWLQPFYVGIGVSLIAISRGQSTGTRGTSTTNLSTRDCPHGVFRRRQV